MTTKTIVSTTTTQPELVLVKATKTELVANILAQRPDNFLLSAKSLASWLSWKSPEFLQRAKSAIDAKGYAVMTSMVLYQRGLIAKYGSFNNIPTELRTKLQ